jgi:hypothetical protein
MTINRSNRRILPVVLAASAALAVAASGDARSVAKPSAAPVPLVLDTAFDPSSMVQIDNAKPGESAGDVTLGAAALRHRGRPYGRLELVDYAVDGRYEGAMQFVTLFLPRGTLAVQGGGVGKAIRGAGRVGRTEVLAITGGTGGYANASGTVSIEHGRNGKDRIVVRVRG